MTLPSMTLTKEYSKEFLIAKWEKEIRSLYPLVLAGDYKAAQRVMDLLKLKDELKCKQQG